ncbi:urease accessory protein [Albidovulum inexpectatum]|uniref:Urease accessory protein UreD n=1 Tax=Albidovulum inexpectatum TaxID=196587 RepID=A0A2S5JH08_9RHOB|nr:urease accessory protein UreD [Albidovulum inexpectatum]PPB80807.1 urease accessory protein [Albidovulum inexpectatum]
MRLQRARGAVAISRVGTRLGRLKQSGCGRLLLPRTHDGQSLGVILNTAGGLTGGDRFLIAAETSDGAAQVLTTQAAERIYRSIGGTAAIATRLKIGHGCSISWLPQETILFQGAALDRTIDVEMAEDARFLGVETVVLGRKAMGEQVTRSWLRDRWRIRRGGRLCHAEALRMGGELGETTHDPALLAGAQAFALIVLVDRNAEAMVSRVRSALREATPRAAASAWDGRLVVRVLGDDLAPVKRLLAHILPVLGATVPAVWQY